jgi:Holliday junction DNA helicase RuvA
MIGWLSGTIRLRDPASGAVVLDVGGVGYQIAVSLQTLACVPDPGEGCELWIHTHAREDTLSLFGFATVEERRMFLMLLGVPKIGPRNAIAVLSGFPLAELVRAIADGDSATLERVPGVGKQIAAQVIVALRDKAAKLLPALAAAPDDGAPRRPVPTEDGRELREEAQAMLTALGWKAKQVDTALDHVMADAELPASLDDLVRRAVARLMER